ncbi:MAG: hydrogenase [Desulfuromonadaceae bacterium]|nr:hydrogenase [Desulfuromonadaceae bacterium]
MRRTGGGGAMLASLMVLAASFCGSFGVICALLSGSASLWQSAWSVPAGQLSIAIDPLSAVFLLPLFLVFALGSIYGHGYWPQREHPESGRGLRFNYGLLAGAMVLLVVARNGVLFLLGWELMALAGFFLITTEQEKADARRAGFIYLCATHTGTLALFAMFSLLGANTGSLAFPLAGSLATGGTAIFLLALGGFGVKAGMMPLHIWLPGAHAAAPSHASAVLSGIMIKTGIYGLVRVTSFFSEIPPWWGWTILIIGAISGIFGVAFAIAQHDIKRLLAYHSVENIGIIALGIGAALLGRSYHIPQLVLLGMAGALLHVINHGLFKALLFLSAGALIHTTGTREIDQYGGLLRRMPFSGLFFLGGAVAICGLPPFNGFISEWLIYLGLFQTVQGQPLPVSLVLLAMPTLAMIGALAVACFVKVFGVTFLGEPRSEQSRHGHEAPKSMLLAMAGLLISCAWIGLFPTSLAPLLSSAVLSWSSVSAQSLAGPMSPLLLIGISGWVLLSGLALVGFWLWRRARHAPEKVATWGCGFPFPSPRMQYTASSFGDFLVRLFRFGLWSERHGGQVEGVFPARSEFSSHTPDTVLDRLLLPVMAAAAWLFYRIRHLVHNGRVGLYLLYVMLALVVLLTATLP